jgi:nucleoside phosphorylase
MVFAASAATVMISEFFATALIFTGVAGGLKPGQEIGDIMLGAVSGGRVGGKLGSDTGAGAGVMISEFFATALIFTGVAGGLKLGQEIGDIMLGAVSAGTKEEGSDTRGRGGLYPWH